jgi:hypothetical protein
MFALCQWLKPCLVCTNQSYWDAFCFSCWVQRWGLFFSTWRSFLYPQDQGQRSLQQKCKNTSNSGVRNVASWLCQIDELCDGVLWEMATSSHWSPDLDVFHQMSMQDKCRGRPDPHITPFLWNGKRSNTEYTIRYLLIEKRWSEQDMTSNRSCTVISYILVPFL